MEVILFLYANGVIQSKILKNKTILCLGDISKDFTVNNMKKTRSNGHVYSFSVDYNTVDISNIWDIHIYLMKNHEIK